VNRCSRVARLHEQSKSSLCAVSRKRCLRRYSLQRMTPPRWCYVVVVLMLLWLGLARSASAESARELRSSAQRALSRLYASTPAARALGDHAAGVLVFPEILKGGFLVGLQYGEGVLFRKGAVSGYFRSSSGSFGLQAGAQKFGYALFFMTESDLAYLDRSGGWELGVGPSITVVDQGVARSLSTTTAQEGMYAFFFEQRGLMGGVSIQGTKLTRIHPH